MHRFHAICLLTLTLACTPHSTAAEGDFPGVKKLMSEKEFTASGLEKLSPEEIRALDQWLVRYTAGEAQVLVNTVEEVKQAEREEEIVSRIAQPFKGWSGNTVFRLENGQVWRQRRRGNYFHDGGDTRVSITRNFMGFYKLTLVESGRSVQVERVE